MGQKPRITDWWSPLLISERTKAGLVEARKRGDQARRQQRAIRAQWSCGCSDREKKEKSSEAHSPRCLLDRVQPAGAVCLHVGASRDAIFVERFRNPNDTRSCGMQRTCARATRPTWPGGRSRPSRSRRSGRTSRGTRPARTRWPPGRRRRAWRSRPSRPAGTDRSARSAGRGWCTGAGRPCRSTRRSCAARPRRPARSSRTTRPKGRSQPSASVPRSNWHRQRALRRRRVFSLAGLRERRDGWSEVRHAGHGSNRGVRAQVT